MPDHPARRPTPPAPPAASPTTDQATGQAPDLALARRQTLGWLEHAVIGLNLCPFAKAPQVKGLVRCVATAAEDADALAQALVAELQHLAATPADVVETTLLVAPRTMADFLDFNDFLAVADAALAALDLEGEIQVASFHPDYEFADAPTGDITHATNRAPWPTLHLIREESIDRAVAAIPHAESIYEENKAVLRRLGADGWAALRARWVGA